MAAKCSIHRNKEVVFVCSDCNELICTKCRVSGHRNHTLEEIEDVSSRERGKLVDFVNDTEENKLPELQKQLESIEKKVAETEYNLGTVLPGKIQQHREICKTDIDRYISKLKSSCEEKKSENIGLLHAYKNEIQQRYARLVLMTKECEQVLQSGTHVLVVDKVKDVECFKTETFSMPVLCTLNYKPGNDFAQSTYEALGTIDIGTSAQIYNFLIMILGGGGMMNRIFWRTVTLAMVLMSIVVIVIEWVKSLAHGVRRTGELVLWRGVRLLSLS